MCDVCASGTLGIVELSGATRPGERCTDGCAGNGAVSRSEQQQHASDDTAIVSIRRFNRSHRCKVLASWTPQADNDQTTYCGDKQSEHSCTEGAGPPAA